MQKLTLIILIAIVHLSFSAHLKAAPGIGYAPDNQKTSIIKINNAEGRSLGALRERQKQVAGANRQADDKQEGTSTYQKIQNWLRVKQAEIIRQLSSYINKFKETRDASFAITLIAASFIYGLVHAAGPGHGKVVVSSYVMANHQTMRRGILLAFLSAFVQGSVAVALVGTLALILGATGGTIKLVGHHLTQISYVLIILLGLYLLISALKPRIKGLFANNAKATNHGNHSDHDHQHSDSCSHNHMPSADELQDNWSLSKVISLTLSVGLRPCTGAVFVLVFALVNGLFWIGILASYAMAFGTAITISVATILTVIGRDIVFFTAGGRSGTASILFDVFATAGALIIIAFGLLLFSTTLGPTRPF